MDVGILIPASWPGFSLTYRNIEAVYAIKVENPDNCQRGVAWVEMDGQRVPGGVITLERGLVKRQVVVMMGSPEQAQEVTTGTKNG